MEDENTHAAVRLKAALAVLERPHFPNPGWQLPAETGFRRERRLMADLAAIEDELSETARVDAPAMRRAPAARA